jgi:hypothetical protein
MVVGTCRATRSSLAPRVSLVPVALLALACRSPSSLPPTPTSASVLHLDAAVTPAAYDAVAPSPNPDAAHPGEAATGAQQDGGARVLEVRNASTQFDFRLVLERPCPAGDDPCSVPANVIVFPKGGTTKLQSIRLPTLWLSSDPSGAPLVNAAPLYDYQGTIIVGDFNFDGNEDFAVQGEQTGPYGGPTFTVFLFAPKVGVFQRAEALSKLTEESLGMFQIDPKRKRLVTLAKDGCCIHIREELEVVGAVPRSVLRVTEDATGEKDVVVTTEHLAGGQWHKETKRSPHPRDP